MSKRAAHSIDEVTKWLLRGDGTGKGTNFRPFFKVRDVSSRGRSAVDIDIKMGIPQHTLSDIEYKYCLLAEYSLLVGAIYCQVALTPLEETLEIASALHIPHPLYQDRKTPRVLTSDVVLDMLPPSSIAQTVISVKPESLIDPKDPSNYRTLQLLLIEKTYWQRRRAHWLIGTDKALPEFKIYNLEFFRSGVKSPELRHLYPRTGELLHHLISEWRPTRTLNALLVVLSSRMHLPVDIIFKLIGRAIWTHVINIDLDTRKLHHEEPLPRPSVRRLDA